MTGRFNFRRRQIEGVADDVATIIAQGPAIASTLAQVIRKLSPYTGTVKLVLNDPALPQVLRRVQTIVSLSHASTGSGSSTTGIGLAKAVPVLDAVIYAKKNPWAPWAVGLGIVALIGGIGYRMGQRKATR